MMNPRKKTAFRTDLCLHVFESPVTGNACHVVSYPDDQGKVLINDLDMGEVYRLSTKLLSRCKVEAEDFQFSWVIDAYDEDLYNEVMETLGVTPQ